MAFRQMVRWAILIAIVVIFLYQKWDSLTLPGGFGGFVVLLVFVVVIVAVVRVLRA